MSRDKVCLNCKNPFKDKSMRNSRKFCYGDCGRKWHNRLNSKQQKAERKKDGPKYRIRRICLTCQKLFWSLGKFIRRCRLCKDKDSDIGIVHSYEPKHNSRIAPG